MLYMELRWKSCDDLLDEKETHQTQCTAFLNLKSIGSINYFFTVIWMFWVTDINLLDIVSAINEVRIK